MLRITRSNEPNSLGLRLEGRLEGPWVEVLRKTWADTLDHDRRRRIVVDLSGVSFADSVGRTLLLNMQGEGVGLIKASAFLREMLKLNGLNLKQHDANEKGE